MTEELKRLNVNLDPETHRLFRLAATAACTDMTEVLKELVEQYIRAHLPPALLPKGRKKQP
jgi:hypothetical protein